MTSSRLVPLLLLGVFACSDDGGYGDYGGFGDDGGEPAQVPDDAVTRDPGTSADCDLDQDVIAYLSPDDSNSMSSPVQVRERVLTDHGSLGSVPIRPWEFMNYYSFAYPAADPGELVIDAALREHPDSTAEVPHFELQLAVSSEAMVDEQRPAMNVTLVLDTSGSMEGQPIELLQASCRAIAASLREGDTVSMVEWDTSNNRRLEGHAVTGPNDPELLAQIASLEPGGGTDLHGGLTAGYELATEAWDPDAINRLVLISDGGANVGITDVDIIAEHAAYAGADGIYLVGAGVDLSGSYNDDLMDTVTDAGKGASVFISDEAEADKVFRDQFINTMVVAARDVQIELTLPPGFEIVRFSGEEYSSDPTEIEPQHLAPNDSMVFFQELITCAPELVADDVPVTVTASWRDVHTHALEQVSRTFSFAELRGDVDQLSKGAAILAYTDTLSGTASVGSALAALAQAEAALPGDPDLAEIHAVLDAL